MKSFILASLLVLFSLPFFSSKVPVLTSVTFIRHSETGASFYGITQQVIEVGSRGDIVMPTRQYVGILAKQYDTGTVYKSLVVSDAAMETNNVYEDKTYSYFSLKTYNDLGVKNQTTFRATSASCAGWGYQRAPYVMWGEQSLPFGCTVIPPTNEWCKITTPEILLDHGTITLKQAEGSTAIANVGVECSTEIAVTFNLVTEDDYIYLDEGQSQITVNNQPLNTSVNMSKGSSSLTVKDLLTGVTTEGFHTGSSVLVMMPY